MTAFVELYADQGATFSATIELYDDANNVPMNLVNVNVSSQIRRSYYTSNVTATLTCNVTSTSNGIMTVSMNANTTANIRAGRYVFDVYTTANTGIVSRPLEGIITISPGVTGTLRR